MNRFKVNCNSSIFLLLLFIVIAISSCSKKTTVTKPPDINTAQLAFERDVFQTYVNEEITPLKGDFRTIVQKFIDTQTKFGSSKDTLIQVKLKELKGSINNSLPYNFNEANQLSHFVSDSVHDSIIEANYYIQLIKLAGYEGRLRESLHYDSVMKIRYPSFRTEAQAFRMNKVADTYTKLNDLGNQQLKEDEYLWKTGVLYKDLFIVTGPFDKGKPLLSYPFSFFRKLLRSYPDSPYADDADYEIMISYDQNEEGAEDQLRWISNYNKFLNAYPGTNCTPDIFKRLAEIHLQYAGHQELSESEREASYLQSRDYIDRLFKKFPDFAKEQDIKTLNDRLNVVWDYFTWSLQIRSDKKEYRPGDPIIITYDLKNSDNKTKKLSLFENISTPNFITLVEYFPLNTDISRYSAMLPEINRDELLKSGLYSVTQSFYDTDKQDTLIFENKRYIEKWNILMDSRISYDSIRGHYDLSKEGKYRITAKAFKDYETAEGELSNSIWVTIIKNPLSN